MLLSIVWAKNGVKNYTTLVNPLNDNENENFDYGVCLYDDTYESIDFPIITINYNASAEYIISENTTLSQLYGVISFESLETMTYHFWFYETLIKNNFSSFDFEIDFRDVSNCILSVLIEFHCFNSSVQSDIIYNSILLSKKHYEDKDTSQGFFDSSTWKNSFPHNDVNYFTITLFLDSVVIV